MYKKPAIAVTGASGRLGEEVVQLLHAGDHRVIAGTRTPAKLAALAANGTEVRRLDLNDPVDVVATALEGVSRVLLVSTDDLSVPGRRQRQHLTLIRAAIDAGVEHISYTSMPKPDADSPVPFALDHRVTEEAIKASGMTWSFLRNSWYFENLLGVLPAVLRTGMWYTAAGDGKLPYVSRRDAARAAASSLLGDPAQGVFDIQGPHAFTVEGLAGAASLEFGQRITVVHVSESELSGKLLAQGIAPDYVPMLEITDANQKLHRFEGLTSAVERLNGAPASSFEAFLREHHEVIRGLTNA